MGELEERLIVEVEEMNELQGRVKKLKRSAIKKKQREKRRKKTEEEQGNGRLYRTRSFFHRSHVPGSGSKEVGNQEPEKRRSNKPFW